MTRRIVAAVLALITARWPAWSIPLGLLTAAHDRRDFRATPSSREVTASAARRSSADEIRGPRWPPRSASSAGSGGPGRHVGRAGALIAGTACCPPRPGSPPRAGSRRAPSQLPGRSLLAVTAGAQRRRAAVLGAVALARPAARSATGWRCCGRWLGVVSLAGLLAAGAWIAIALARWVSGPIGALAEAARRPR